MTKILAALTLTLLAGPALAQSYNNPSIGPRIFLKDAIGQRLYDVHGMDIGTIRGVTAETGQASVIVSTPKAGPGTHEVLIVAAELQPRKEGGWFSSLPAGSILDLPPYIPGRMTPPGPN